MNEGYVLNDEGPVCWQETGAGVPVIFLHAMVGSRTAWCPQFEHLAKKYRCISWDMPGFGNSAPLLDSDGMDVVVELLHRFVVETLELPSANFVGLSVGGMILQHFASRYPELVQTATIMDSSPKFGLSGDIDPNDFIDPILTQLQSGVDVRSFSTEMVDAVVGPKCLDSVKKEAIDSMSRATPSGLALTTRLIGTHNALECLSKITSPCLVLVGEDDTDTPPSYAQAIADAIADARLEVIKGAGHISNLENPDQVNELLSAFLLTHEVG